MFRCLIWTRLDCNIDSYCIWWCHGAWYILKTMLINLLSASKSLWSLTSSMTGAKDENRRESWNQSMNRSQSLPTQLPARAHLPSFAGTHKSFDYFSQVIWASHMISVFSFLEPYKYFDFLMLVWHKWSVYECPFVIANTKNPSNLIWGIMREYLIHYILWCSKWWIAAS